MFSDEIICKELARIAAMLERIELRLDQLVYLPAPLPPVPSSKKSTDGLMMINETEASELTGLSVSWFRRKRWEGDGPPYIKTGNSVRYKVSELEKWMSSHQVNHTSEWTERERKKHR